MSLECLGLKPSSITSWLNDFRQVISAFSLTFGFLSAKLRKKIDPTSHGYCKENV